ncbi:MAG: hypothetical protein LBG25_03725 [Spirochaetaceae bacterium]|jgi:hypothetical protein|nr:hypothetical protein [Spirochaetaceae bacterium]
MAKEKQKKTIASYPHAGEKRKNIPTAELQSVVDNDTRAPRPRKYPRNTDLDPPYGIKFNSNFQWSTTSRDVKDGKTDHITREPEQVKELYRNNMTVWSCYFLAA